LLACDQDTVHRVAARYLRDAPARSAVGILAGDDLLAGAHGELEALGTRFARL